MQLSWPTLTASSQPPHLPASSPPPVPGPPPGSLLDGALGSAGWQCYRVMGRRGLDASSSCSFMGPVLDFLLCAAAAAFRFTPLALVRSSGLAFAPPLRCVPARGCCASLALSSPLLAASGLLWPSPSARPSPVCHSCLWCVARQGARLICSSAPAGFARTRARTHQRGAP